MIAPPNNQLDAALLDRLMQRAATRPHNGDARDQIGHIIDTALIVLADGHARTGDEIWVEAKRRGLHTAKQQKDVYIALFSYIERHSGQGRWCAIVQDVDRRFRLNHPLDDWPDPKKPLPTRAPVPRFDDLRKDLEKHQRGDDAAAFEFAVCNAFAAMGFIVQHVGGNGAPDGYMDAPLGPLGYRAMIECKRAKLHYVLDADSAEAARYRTPYKAKYATLIGPLFEQGVTMRDELLTHGVSCWTTGDLVQCMENGCDPVELEPLFAPGFARQRAEEITWERDHGAAKRTAVVCDLLHENAARIQTTALTDPADAPHLDANAALLMVDASLTAVGAHVPCTLADIQCAFRHLTDPLVAEAIYTDQTQTSIVFRSIVRVMGIASILPLLLPIWSL